MKKFAYIILILCLYSCRHETGIVRETINELDATLGMKETYEKAFASRIKSIREVYRSDRSYENQIAFNFRMANEFRSNNFDSTVSFSHPTRGLLRNMMTKSVLRLQIFYL